MNDESKLWAFLSVLLSIVGVILAYVLKKDDQYVLHYAKQSLVLFLAWVVLSALNWLVLWRIPVIGGFVYWLAALGLFVLWIIGMVYAYSGERKDIPVIGSLSEKF